jgi:hypothetical protein
MGPRFGVANTRVRVGHVVALLKLRQSQDKLRWYWLRQSQDMHTKLVLSCMYEVVFGFAKSILKRAVPAF